MVPCVSRAEQDGEAVVLVVLVMMIPIYYGGDAAMLFVNCVEDCVDDQSRQPPQEAARFRTEYLSNGTTTTDAADFRIQIAEAIK